MSNLTPPSTPHLHAISVQWFLICILYSPVMENIQKMSRENISIRFENKV